MPRLQLAALSADARVWIFASDRPVSDEGAEQLLKQVDDFLEKWHAHGSPLTSARDWRDRRFLLIAADGEAASGCSIDGLFRTLKNVGAEIGTNLVTSGLIFYRDVAGEVQSSTRARFTEAASSGAVTPHTSVFDTSLTTLGDVRDRFERSAGESWHAALLPLTRS
ncbi:MAG: hypothetical protein ACR2HZ_04525 [Gemmatimonadaceae bacterium]